MRERERERERKKKEEEIKESVKDLRNLL